MACSRLALVTGSTSGIGLAIAKVLSARGCALVLNGIDKDEVVSSAVEQCLQQGATSVQYHGANLSHPEQIEDLFGFIRAKCGKTPDILVNNAGVQYVNTIENFPAEKWDFILSINLTACFHTIKHSLPGMRERGWGRIVNISSVHGLVASPNKCAYVAAKHGVIGLTKVTALECAGSGTTCNAVCPGWVLTPILVQQIEAIAKKHNVSYEEAKVILVSEKHPSKESVLPEEMSNGPRTWQQLCRTTPPTRLLQPPFDLVGGLVGYLCSEEARQVTGSSFPIDGGWTTQ